MMTLLKRLDALLHRQWPLLVTLFILVVLRLPNFFEPYWYGDEGIYLTLGMGLRYGERLYAEIIDHKTPLIYYLAMLPTQLHFRVLLFGWMLATTTAFYTLTLSLLKRPLVRFIATFLFMLFTTLPWLEGNIPNGELFVMGFILVGAVLFTHTEIWKGFFGAESSPQSKVRLPDSALLFLSGIFFCLGILTKVPALFDLAAFLSLSWFTLMRMVPQLLKKPSQLFYATRQLIGKNLWVMLGVLVPIIISVLYYVARGSGQAYLDYGLLYNFRYAGSWNLPFESKALLFFFSLPGKALIAGAMIMGLTLLSKVLRPHFQFVATWVILAFFASLLSNRPYPHYFLQAIPPLALLIGVVLDGLAERRLALTSLFKRGIESSITLGLFVLLFTILKLLDFGLYPTASYYGRWFKLMSGQMSSVEYRNSFNYLMDDNYRAAEIIKTAPEPYMFIWGTNPMLYALAEKVPTGRFTVSFHIKDFKAYPETYQSIVDRQPTFIVVMNDEQGEFPEFYSYLNQNYMPAETQFQHFTLWRAL